jgi:hypothetical protein
MNIENCKITSTLHHSHASDDSLPVVPSASPAAPLVPISAPVSSAETVAMLDAKPLPPPAHPRKLRRHGRIASLPKLERDMVNRMLWNNIPYKNIVAALDNAGFSVNERNVSNWATGGYLEWRLEQEAVLQNRLDQDHLLDFLRRDDAPEISEVGLQAAATRLSQLFLQKLANAQDPEADLDNYTKLVNLLCRLNREIAATQKLRDDSRQTLGPEHNPARVKEVEQLNAIENERDYSNPPEEFELAKPAVPPLLPRIPTAASLAEEAREARMDAQLEALEHRNAILKALLPKKTEQAAPAPGSSSPFPGTPHTPCSRGCPGDS